MVRKYFVLISIITSVVLMVIAASVYPGGSILDNNSIGFNWSKNFISNLFGATALNGAENPGRIWALIGMFLHSVGYGVFFIHTSGKMPVRSAAIILKFIGFANMLFAFLIVTPLHDSMVTITATLFLLGLFYITVFLLKSKLYFLKISAIICLLIFYYTLYLYGTGNWGLLAIMQKVSFISSMLLVLGIEYFSKVEDFKPLRSGAPKIEVTSR